MRHDETRDNTTAIEANLSEADAREEAREADHIRNSRHIRLVDPREMERVADPSDPEHDPIGDADTEYDIEYDDGQPSEYEEWQDYMGGDEYYDHSENGVW